MPVTDTARCGDCSEVRRITQVPVTLVYADGPRNAHRFLCDECIAKRNES